MGAKFQTQNALVRKWYQLDLNATPPEYTLQTIVEYEETERYLQEQDFKVVKKQTAIGIRFQEENLVEDTPEMEKQKAASRAKYQELLGQRMDTWKKEEPVVAKTIRLAVEQCMKAKTIRQEDAMKYFKSSKLLC